MRAVESTALLDRELTCASPALALGPPPHTVSQMLISRKWCERFGGSFHGDLSTGWLIWAALNTDEVDLLDLIKFRAGQPVFP